MKPALWAMLLVVIWVQGLGLSEPAFTPPTPQPAPDQHVDRLAIPALPPDPTEVDRGNVVYYYHCMPCHGDQRQGLTDEFRQIWVEDHQNCWARGCHGGRIEDEGFPLPRYIPALTDLSRFSTLSALQEYLKATHPPQTPGVLSNEEYHAVAVFLAHNCTVGPAEQEKPIHFPSDSAFSIVGLSLALLTCLKVSSILFRNRV